MMRGLSPVNSCSVIIAAQGCSDAAVIVLLAAVREGHISCPILGCLFVPALCDDD